eukprot:NODE_256_length_12667_cov_0.196292.p2 type:complete len:397 gc:universal NODE_256_length_12667_cov_0.196292:1935-3125(+)
MGPSLKNRRISRAMASSFAHGKRKMSKFKSELAVFNSLSKPVQDINNTNNNSLDRWKEEVDDPLDNFTEKLTGFTYYMDENNFFFVFLPHKTHKDDIMVFKIYKNQIFVAQMNIAFIDRWKSENKKKIANRSSSFNESQYSKNNAIRRRSQSLTINREESRNIKDLFYSLKFDRVGLVKFCKIIDMTQENDSLVSFLLTNKNYIFYLQALNSVSKRKFTNLIYYHCDLQITKISSFVGDPHLNQGNSISKVVEKHKENIKKTVQVKNRLGVSIEGHTSEISRLNASMNKYLKYEVYLSNQAIEAVGSLKKDFTTLSINNEKTIQHLRVQLDNVDVFIAKTRNDVDSKMKDALSKLSGFRSHLKAVNEKQDKYRRRAMLVSFLIGITTCFLSIIWFK